MRKISCLDFIAVMNILSAMGKNLLVILLLCMTTASCSTSRRVVVEPYPSDLRPWQRPYTVDGERFVPLLRADGYKDKGFASWYGKEEHGKPTSNGEVFDMYKPSAAHKTLPLGCFVKVTNIANHKQTVVRVNDRGPFIPGRIIDLSYQSAKELDFVDGGVTPVTIEVVPSSAAILINQPSIATDRIYKLQVAAYSDREKARLLADRLKKEFSFSDIQTVRTDNGVVYRVRVGRFRTWGDAETAKAALTGNGYPSAFILSE
jgi:rare lipoprotein A